MKKYQHLVDYILITAVIVVFFLSVIFFRFTHLTIKLVATASAVSYVVWGVIHHTKAVHLDKKILLEYAGIAALGLIIVFSLIN